ncbi:cryptochrome/photolyase family protein [Pseudonocardia xishanensis]|uniref:Cryptochrome/photolyase family protein n=1 Tax=Pseudonocardia xishanensis TaxID=630995 RepID=A0ABP8S4P5_9PSEU
MEPLWLFADQLGPHVHATDGMRDREVVLVESTRALRRKRFHRQKLHLVLSGMRHLAAELGDRARYVEADIYREALEQVGEPVVVHEPTSFAAADLVERLRRDGLVADILPTPTFALSRTEFADWAGDRERFRMEDFYRAQRERFSVLMDGAEPVGGRWNLDADNREPPPKRRTLEIEGPWQPTEDEIDEQVRADLEDVPSVGVDGPRWFAITHAEAQKALRHFVKCRLAAFGPYGDAIMSDDWATAHSLLSVPLNHGVLHPLDAVHAAEQAGTALSRSPRPRASSGRSSAGGSTSGSCTGGSVAGTCGATPCAPRRRCRTGSRTSTRTPSPRPACGTRSPGCATGAGSTTSRG